MIALLFCVTLFFLGCKLRLCYAIAKQAKPLYPQIVLNITNSFWHAHILISQDGFSERGKEARRTGKAPRGKTITASSSSSPASSSCMPSLFGGEMSYGSVLWSLDLRQREGGERGKGLLDILQCRRPSVMELPHPSCGGGGMDEAASLLRLSQHKHTQLQRQQ